MFRNFLFLSALLFVSSCQNIQEQQVDEVPIAKFETDVFEVSAQNAIIVWDDLDEVDQNSITYQIILNEETVEKELSGGFTYTFKDLNPKTEYTGQIRAVDEEGNTSMASSFTFKTKSAEDHFLSI